MTASLSILAIDVSRRREYSGRDAVRLGESRRPANEGRGSE